MASNTREAFGVFHDEETHDEDTIVNGASFAGVPTPAEADQESWVPCRVALSSLFNHLFFSIITLRAMHESHTRKKTS